MSRASRSASAKAPAAAGSGAAKRTATSAERVAGLGFLAFVICQIPVFVVRTNRSPTGFQLLSPLQVAATSLATDRPDLTPYAEAALFPGGWLRETVGPYMRCVYKSKARDRFKDCKHHLLKLTDMEFVAKRNNLPALKEMLAGPDMKGQATIIKYGCWMVVVSSVMSLVFSVKSALVGFALIFYGVFQGAHMALPPGALMCFLCIYAGFGLDQPRSKGGPKRAVDLMKEADGEEAVKEGKQAVSKQATGSSSGKPPKPQKKRAA